MLWKTFLLQLPSSPLLSLLLLSFFTFQLVSCGLAPVLIASHRLVPDLTLELQHSNIKPHDANSVTNLIKKLVTQCSSNAYLIVDIPGITYKDLNVARNEYWPYLRNYLYMSSTMVGLPKVENDGLDLNYLEEYIIKTCEAETIVAPNGEVADYYDVRKRVIRVNFNAIERESQSRGSWLLDCDQKLRKILRMLPSPHYTVILTSSTPGIVHPVPENIIKNQPEKHEIFHDIINNPKHNGGVEKNDRFHKAEPNWNPIRDSNTRYLEKKKKDEIHLFDYDLWVKNEKLITTVFVMILSLFMLKTLSFMNYIKSKFRGKVKRKQI